MSLSFTSSGEHTIGFGVLDVDGLPGDSFLLIDNIVSRTVAKPSTMVITGLGLLGIGRRRRPTGSSKGRSQNRRAG